MINNQQLPRRSPAGAKRRAWLPDLPCSVREQKIQQGRLREQENSPDHVLRARLLSVCVLAQVCACVFIPPLRRVSAGSSQLTWF